tara:strand:- start:63810 stop:64910 length:1101 start_codon:yes stop_codon:yes gene_type:complete
MSLTTAAPGTQHADAAERVRRACAAATSTRELLEAVGDITRAELGADGSFVCTTDPVTALPNAEAVVVGLPDGMRYPWMRNEFIDDDLNKFGDLHARRVPAATLHRAIADSGRESVRHHDVNRRFGFGHEIRAVFSQNDACWGILNLVRVAGEPDFDDADLDFLAEIAEPVVEALRGLVLHRPTLGPENVTPGVVMLDPAGRVISLSDSARLLLDDLWLVPLEGGLDEVLPCQAYTVGWVATAQALGVRSPHSAVTRVQGVSGHWLTLRGTHAATEQGDLMHIIVTIEPSRPDDILTMLSIAYNLTQREQEVFAELRAGASIEETAARMFISPHTLRAHMRSLFAKAGCSSRGELLSRLFVHRTGA